MKQPISTQETEFEVATLRVAILAMSELVSASVRKDTQAIKFIDAVSNYLIMARDLVLDKRSQGGDNKNSPPTPVADATGDPTPHDNNPV